MHRIFLQYLEQNVFVIHKQFIQEIVESLSDSKEDNSLKSKLYSMVELDAIYDILTNQKEYIPLLFEHHLESSNTVRISSSTDTSESCFIPQTLLEHSFSSERQSFNLRHFYEQHKENLLQPLTPN